MRSGATDMTVPNPGAVIRSNDSPVFGKAPVDTSWVIRRPRQHEKQGERFASTRSDAVPARPNRVFTFHWHQAPPSQRLATLRAVTKLFLANAPGLSEDKVEIFDTVFQSLVDKIDHNCLMELSECLAPIDNAPRRIIKRLASDPEIRVARPVLVQSPRLSTDDLVELAQTQSQAHLLAISKRAALPERATDVLIQRGNREVVHSVASNRAARLSDKGLAALSMRAAQDERIAAAISGRPDVPPEVFRHLLSNALTQLEAKTRS